MNNILAFFRESKLGKFFLPIGIFLIIFSVFMLISDERSKGFIETEAVITSSILVKEETFDVDGNREPAEYMVSVKYTVEGKEYETEFGIMMDKSVGNKIKIVYNPNDPTDIASPASPILNIVLLVIGVITFVWGIISIINSIKQNKVKSLK